MILKTEDAELVKKLTDEIFKCCDELPVKGKNHFESGQICAFLHVLRTIEPLIDEDILQYFGLEVDADTIYRLG